uniref:PEP-CTERM sorting domain-containing protein n=1 Tax=Fervidobacterium pennivorans TaxID=93466 RepID=A0A7V4CLT1_FERPE
MRCHKSFWVLNYVAIAIVGFIASYGATTGQAAPLTNTEISWDQFANIANISNPIVTDTTRFFNFEVDGNDIFFPDGSVYSQVFPGIGNASGLNVYVYQFQISPLWSDVSLTGVSFSFIFNPENTPVSIPSIGNITSFWINEDNPDIGFSDASVEPLEVIWDEGVLKIYFSLASPGETSFIIGTFAPANMPPALTVATLGTNPIGNPIIKPSVYTPTPEPSAALLLGLSLTGSLLFRRRHRFGII